MVNIIFQKYLTKINIRFENVLIKGTVFHVFRYIIRLSSRMMTCPSEAFKTSNSIKYFMISEKTIS